MSGLRRVCGSRGMSGSGSVGGCRCNSRGGVANTDGRDTGSLPRCIGSIAVRYAGIGLILT